MIAQRDGYILRTGREFAEGWLYALPTGAAWRKEPTSSLYKFSRGLNEVFGYVAQRLDDLIVREADPNQTLELLEDWERAYGLPDSCLSAPVTIEGRRAALVEKITSLGGQSLAYFMAIAERLGYSITIREHTPFMVGVHEIGAPLLVPFGYDLVSESGSTLVTEDDSVISTEATGDPAGYYPEIGDYEMRYYWVVSVGARPFFWFRTGTGFPNDQGGETGVDPHLRISAAFDLECIFNKLKPAHTIVVFDYTGLPVPDPMAGLP